MSVQPGRFSEFMVKGAETEPESANPVFDEKAGVEMGEPVATGADLTTPTPTPQQNQQSIPPDPVPVWPLVEGAEPNAVAVTPGTVIKSWDGSTALQVTLPNKLHIRSLWFMRAPGQQISIYAGGNTNGAQLTGVPLSGQCAEVLNVPDGNTTVTLVAAKKFSQPIGVMFTDQLLPIVKQNETAFPDGATPFFAKFSPTVTSGTRSFTSSLGASALIGQTIYITQLRIVGVQGNSMPWQVVLEDAASVIQFLYGETTSDDITTPFTPPIFGGATITANGDPQLILSFGSSGTGPVSGFLAGYFL